jgi:hypothetical protein
VLHQLARGVKTGDHKVLLTGDRKEMRKNKIILMGDSHMKGHACKLLNRLDRKFEVMGMVMPGA